MTSPNHAHAAYSAEPVQDSHNLVDVRVLRDGRTQYLAGRRGEENERARLAALPESGVLPVFLGAGLGRAVQACLDQGRPVAVVDQEDPILALTGIRQKWAGHPLVYWVQGNSPDAVLNELTRWQLFHDGLPFAPVLDPFYARLNPALYRVLADRLAVSQQVNFWAKARYPKFSHPVPRILLLTTKYFLMGEMQAACDRLGYATSFVQLPEQEVGTQEFVESMLSEILRFQPDFILTINHLGLDKEGVLTGLLARLELPLASWFVDNPHLILYLYGNLNSDWVSIFTWDADNLASLKAQGFRTHYLPLAADPHRFALRRAAWEHDVAFVGNSMVHKVQGRLDKHPFLPRLVADRKKLAQAFMRSGELSISLFLQASFPEHAALFAALPSVEAKLAYEAMLTWQATLMYRLERVQQLLPFAPLVAGDSGWHELLPQKGWRYHPELHYYTDLPAFYPTVRVNFNCTSQQMKGAVNQRVFDVPACGAFLLTDHRRQMEDLFEPDREIVCYHEAEEIPDLVRYYLAHDTERARIATAGRKRILAEHTYDLRIESLARTMRQTYG